MLTDAHRTSSSCVCIRIVVACFHWSLKFFFSKYAWRNEQIESTHLIPCKTYDYVTNLRHVIYSTPLFSINNTNNKSIQFSPYTFLSIPSFFSFSRPYYLRTFKHIGLTHLNIDRYAVRTLFAINLRYMLISIDHRGTDVEVCKKAKNIC